MKIESHLYAPVLLSVLCAFATHLGAADYYVDKGNPSASDSNPGSATSPWKSIAKANQSLSAGDTVYIKQGSYSDYVAPVRSGSASSRITYRNYGSDSVTITQTSHAVVLNGNSYITVQGINFYMLDAFVDFTGASHNILAYCKFDQMRNAGDWSGSKIEANSQYNWIHDCVFSNYGYCTTDDFGSVLDIGNEQSKLDHSDYNLIENSTFFHGGHHVLGVFGTHNIVRNNYFHNENWSNGYGNRNVYLHGYDESSGRNLVEGNRIGPAGQPPDNTDASGMYLITKSNIVRFNCFYGATGSGLMMGATASYNTGPANNRIYNNTFYKNGQSVNSGSGAEELDGLGLANWESPYLIVGNAIKNNVFYSNPTAIGTYRVNLTDQIIAGNWQQTGDPLFVDISTPITVSNPNLPDFHLRTNSPCIDKGGYLTTITSPSGSGRTFKVADPTYFMDGWGIVQGDLIQLQGTTQRGRITSIDYGAATMTVDSSLTWTQNQGIALAYEGASPDIGAFENASALSGTNLPPVVQSGPNQIIGFPTNTVTLAGTASDPNHDPLNFSWSQLSGPAAASFSAANSSNTVATISVRGVYVFRLTVSDGKVSSYADTTVTFAPDPKAITFEAENGTLTAPFVVQSGYIVQNSEAATVSDGGRAAYVFIAPEAGNYLVSGVVNAPDAGANSFLVNMDAEPVDPTMVWDIPLTSGFESRAVSWRGTGTLEAPKLFLLTAGSHTLIIRGREAGVQLDRIEVTKADSGAKPVPPTNLRVISAP